MVSNTISWPFITHLGNNIYIIIMIIQIVLTCLHNCPVIRGNATDPLYHSQVVYGLNTRGEELEGQLVQAQDSQADLRRANEELHRDSIYRGQVRYIEGRRSWTGTSYTREQVR